MNKLVERLPIYAQYGWTPVQQEPTEAGWYQILYEGDPPTAGPEFYSVMFWDEHNWHVKTLEGEIGSKSIFGNHQRMDVEEFWRKIP